MFLNFLPILAADSYDQITFESFFDAFNPFGKQGITDLFGFVRLVASTLMGLIGLLSVIYIIIGGYQLITSSGNPEATKKAITTLTWAVLGLIIASLAVLIVNFVFTTIGAKIPTTGS